MVRQYIVEPWDPDVHGEPDRRFSRQAQREHGIQWFALLHSTDGQRKAGGQRGAAERLPGHICGERNDKQ